MISARLRSMFQARSLVIVGATERSRWSNMAYGNCKALGFAPKVQLVHPKGGMAYGRPVATSCAALGASPDVALMMVPGAALFDALVDVAAAGIGNAVILSSGFGETGADGEGRQEALLGLARRLDITFLGPNCLGFVNYLDGVAVWTGTVKTPKLDPLAIVSQSGAVASHISDLATRQGLGISYQIATGNEADVTTAQVIDFLVDDPRVKVIMAFIESTRDTETLIDAARRGLLSEKAIVALKIGSGKQTARAAEAHTGSIIGDDRLFSAACRQFGIVRVASIEEMVTTAEVMMRMPAPAGPALGVVSMSGGMCEIASDRADAVGAPLFPFSDATKAALSRSVPDFGTIHNPLDLTGAAVLEPAHFTDALTTIADDPDIGAVLAIFDPPRGQEGLHFEATKSIGAATRGASAPVVMMSTSIIPVSVDLRKICDECGVTFIGCGIEHGIAAIAHLFRWAGQLGRGAPAAAELPSSGQAWPGSEYQALDYLASMNVPAIRPVLAVDAAAAVAAAAGISGPVALKIASSEIAHKTEIGGVILDVVGAEEVSAGFRTLMERARRAAPAAAIEGVLVAPMRRDGVELFVGIARDPHWGPTIALGLGGIWVEALNDTSLRVLPVSDADVLDMLGELRGQKILDGFRGRPAVDRLALAGVVRAIAEAALALGPDLAAFEINPLWARADQIEALDALAAWGGGPGR